MPPAPSSRKSARKPSPVSCPICEAIIGRKSDLARHMRTHDPEKDVLMFRCPYKECDYKNLQKPNVVTHIRTHTGERVPCPSCDFSCTDPGSLNRHRKRNHNYNPKPRKKPARKVPSAGPPNSRLDAHSSSSGDTVDLTPPPPDAATESIYSLMARLPPPPFPLLPETLHGEIGIAPPDSDHPRTFSGHHSPHPTPDPKPLVSVESPNLGFLDLLVSSYETYSQAQPAGENADIESTGSWFEPMPPSVLTPNVQSEFGQAPLYPSFEDSPFDSWLWGFAQQSVNCDTGYIPNEQDYNRILENFTPSPSGTPESQSPTPPLTPLDPCLYDFLIPTPFDWTKEWTDVL